MTEALGIADFVISTLALGGMAAAWLIRRLVARVDELYGLNQKLQVRLVALDVAFSEHRSNVNRELEEQKGVNDKLYGHVSELLNRNVVE